jgi:hypothetical protein
MVLGYTGTVEPGGIGSPALGQKQPQSHHDRHFARSQRQRHQRLAVGVLAKRRGILRRDADRVAPLLGERGVVHDQPRIVPANLSVGLRKEHLLQRRSIPHAARDEVVQLVIVDACVARRHRLNALAIPKANQPSNIGRTHPRTRLVPQRRDERLKPLLQIDLPIPVHGRPLQQPTPHESRKTALGNPQNAPRTKNLPK